MNAITSELRASNKPSVVTSLEDILRETYALYRSAHQHHWNVEGARFKALHDFFEEQYRDNFEALDAVAERIRMLGVQVAGDFAAGQTVASPAGGNSEARADAMIADLIARNESVAAALKSGIEVAANAGDPTSEDLMTGRLAVHEKSVWMLKSMLA